MRPKPAPVMKRPVVLAVLVCVAAMPASGQQRLSTTRLTCREASEIVKRQGSVELGTGGSTYDRYVRDRSFCEITEIAELRFVPTRDNPQCPVGYRCKEPDYDEWDWE